MTRLAARERMLIMVAGLVSIAALSADTVRREPHPRDAISAIIAAFDTHRAVLLGEAHWSVTQHRFIQRLLRDSRLAGRVDDIAVEFANSRYQPLIDRYIAGERVPADSLRQAWQNTIVAMAWDPPMYADFFRTVREVNLGLPPARRFRVLALDPPIAWDSTHAIADIPRRWGYRDPVWMDVLEREVFARQRHVLVICGALHIIRREPTAAFLPASLDRAGLGDALQQRHPGASYAIFPAIGTHGVAALVKHWPAATLEDIQGTAIGTVNSHVLMPGDVVVFSMVDGKRVPRPLTDSDFPKVEQMVDAIIYYGPDTSLAKPVLTSYRDRAYVAELHRRSAIVQPIFGQDLDPVIDSLAKAARARGAPDPND